MLQEVWMGLFKCRIILKMAKTANDNGERMFDNYYQPIDPSLKYDREDFTRRFEDFSDLSGYLEDLVKDPNNPSAMTDLGGLLHGDSAFYYAKQNPSLVARTDVDRALSQSVDAVAKYVEKNFDSFLGKCTDQDLLSYVLSVPVYKTKSDGEHNDFVDALNNIKTINEIAREGDPGKARDFVARRMENAPDWLKESLSLMQGNTSYVQGLFQEFAKYEQAKFEAMIRGEDGNIRKNFLEGVIKDSLESAYKQHREETHPKDKSDIWKANIRPYLMPLAEIVFPREKANSRKDEDSSRVERKNERRSLGMAA